MLLTPTRTEPAPQDLPTPRLPALTGTAAAKPAAPEPDAQQPHWGDGIALRLWALGFLLLFALLVLEALGDVLRR